MLVRIDQHLDIGLEQIKAGLAWHFKRYEHEQTAENRASYAAAEAIAKATRRGLWRDPEHFRLGSSGEIANICHGATVNRSYEREPSERLVLLAAFVAAVAIAGGGLYFVLQKAAPIAAPAATTQANRPAPPTVQATATAPVVAPAVIVPATNTGPAVYRCTINGVVIYSDEMCQGAKKVDARPASSGFVAERPRPAVRVAQAPSTEPMSMPSAASTSATEKAAREARCAWIEAEIERIDALARQGQSASSQDSLRERRRKLVDEKYALKC